jgi:hypothetical protein
MVARWPEVRFWRRSGGRISGWHRLNSSPATGVRSKPTSGTEAAVINSISGSTNNSECFVRELEKRGVRVGPANMGALNMAMQRATPRVMISYSSSDSDFVDELRGLLETQGISPWIDKTGIGPRKKWHTELLTQLRECHVLVPILSRAFLASDPCKMEVFIARSGGKRIVPIMYSMDLQYEELTEFPETKGLEDLFMFRVVDDGPSEAMALTIGRDEALARTCQSIVEQPKELDCNLAYIAYLRKDVTFATRLADGLSAQGVKTWIATRDIPVGANFMQAQIAAMMNAAALIVVLGEGLETSGYIRTELNLAKAQGIELYPVLPQHLVNSKDARDRLMNGLRSKDHTLELYQTQAYQFLGDYGSFVGQIRGDLPELTMER